MRVLLLTSLNFTVCTLALTATIEVLLNTRFRTQDHTVQATPVLEIFQVIKLYRKYITKHFIEHVVIRLLELDCLVSGFNLAQR